MRYLAAALLLSGAMLFAEEPKSIPMTGEASSYLMIDPKSRALDLKEAFELFRKEKTATKVVIQLANQTSISNILDFNVMQNGTIIVVRYNSVQGIKFMMVNVEDIVAISSS